MDIVIKTNFDEDRCLRLLNWLTRENAAILTACPELPLLYDSHVVYRTERGEVWSDVKHTLIAGHEDCDALACYRAAELLARGAMALRRSDNGYAAARRRRLTTIHAEPMLTTRTKPGEKGLFHVVVRYCVGGRWFTDDPSARLGMNGRFDPSILGRRAGNRQRQRRAHEARRRVIR